MLKEHLRVPSSIYQHSQTMGHPVNVECFTIMDMEAHGVTRIIKEAMFIWVDDPLLNSNLGKYQLPHIWDEVMQETQPLYLR